jgi:hypothetical protein
MIMETTYLTKMSTGKQGSPGNQIIERRHTRHEIISRAKELLAKELGQDLATYAELEEVGMRGRTGENTVYGYVDTSGKKIEFTETLKLKAAIAVLNLNGHFFEVTPMTGQEGTAMNQMTDTNTTQLRIVQQQKLDELQSHQKNLHELKAELEKINLKIKKHEKLSEKDIQYISELGWLAALSVTIASIAASI